MRRGPAGLRLASQRNRPFPAVLGSPSIDSLVPAIGIQPSLPAWNAFAADQIFESLASSYQFGSTLPNHDFRRERFRVVIGGHDESVGTGSFQD
jgi:hypothetical protein